MCKHDDEFRRKFPRYLELIPKFISSLAETNVLGARNGLHVKAMCLSTALEPEKLLEVIDQCPNVRSLDTTLWSESLDTDSEEDGEWTMEREYRGEFQPSRSHGCAAWNELLEARPGFLRPLRSLKVRPFSRSQLYMNNDGPKDNIVWRDLNDTYAVLDCWTGNKPEFDLASERLHQLMKSIESLQFLELRGRERWTHPDCTWSVQDTLLLGKMQSLRRLDFAGCHGLVRNLKNSWIR